MDMSKDGSGQRGVPQSRVHDTWFEIRHQKMLPEPILWPAVLNFHTAEN